MGVMIDEHLNWASHVQNKLPVKQTLPMLSYDETSPLALYTDSAIVSRICINHLVSTHKI